MVRPRQEFLNVSYLSISLSIYLSVQDSLQGVGNGETPAGVLDFKLPIIPIKQAINQSINQAISICLRLFTGSWEW